jgi:hypothetical protein
MLTSRLPLILFLFSSLTVFSIASDPEELVWPREVDTQKGLVTFYQPQIDSYVANILEGRCAMSFKPIEGDVVFGAFWFRAFLQTDTEARTAILDQVDVLDVNFPGLDDSLKMAEAAEGIQRTIENMNIVMSLDRLIASLEELDQGEQPSTDLNNTPPRVIYKKEPTMLVSIDGEPIWQDDDKNNLKYVLNSPFFIAQDKRSKNYYINGGGNWYVTKEPPTGWKLTTEVASNVKSFAEANAPQQPEDAAKTESKLAPPAVIVTYEPTELIVTDGEPNYQPIENTQLLYVKNTDSDIIMDVKTQFHYVLISGRWYKANKLDGDEWAFEEPASLPEDFKNIPTESDVASVRASIPDTPEARDALLEQTIPQTAEVVRSEAKVEVKFDGDPKFKNIPNTEVAYAENSDKTVLKIHQEFYVVDNGIWFVSNYPKGPYEVSDKRPPEVDAIPADEPVHNVKYVYVYNSTPEVVYVGYLPGYTHSYVYNGVVVYGTGYRYPYWYGSYYYPRPVTYGFNVHYNPYSGWGFSMGFSYGWIGWGYHSYYRPYWGPCGYHAGYRGGYYHGYNRGYNAGYNRGLRAGYAAGSRNAYRNQSSGVRNTTYNKQQLAKRDISRPGRGPNNVVTDRNGNAHQRDKSGNWNQVSGNKPGGGTKDASRPGTRPSNPSKPATRPTTNPSTKPSQPTTKPSTRPSKPTTKPSQPSTRPAQPTTRPSTRPSQPSSKPTNFDRTYQNRQRGTQNYNRSRQSAPSRSVPRGRR